MTNTTLGPVKVVQLLVYTVQGIFSPSCNLNRNLYIDIDILTIVDVALVNVKRDWLRNSGVLYGLNGQYFFNCY